MFIPFWCRTTATGLELAEVVLSPGRRSPLLQSLMDDLAGRSLVEAAGFLGTLSHFAEEED